MTHNLREAILLGDEIHLMGAGGRPERSWSVDVPRGDREHHPSLRPLEQELRDRLHLEHPRSAPPLVRAANG